MRTCFATYSLTSAATVSVGASLSTPLLRQMRDELRQIEQRESQAVAATAPWNAGTRGTGD
jgi:hypothetical protein